MNSPLAETAALMDDLGVPPIFGTAFRFEGIVVRVEVLERRPRKQVAADRGEIVDIQHWWRC
jgi:hypothetical protein